MTPAYSYIRFSSCKQELGDSLRRQVEKAEAYCHKNGLDLQPLSFRDLGVSAFKRHNIEKGALFAFLVAVHDGNIAKGSYLIVEQFDRLSRADIDIALKLLLNIVHSGIIIVTLDDGKVWDRAAVRDTGALILAIVWMSRANNESAAKADRLTAVWQSKQKRAVDGVIVTSVCPMWLAPMPNKSGFLVDEAKAESVRRVFAARAIGMGSSSIMNQANREGWPVPGKQATWHTSLVQRLLNNRAVLGEYQPMADVKEHDWKREPRGEPIKGYYPPILTEEEWNGAQASRARRGSFPGRRDVALRNWLQGLIECDCGKRMHRKDKSSRTQPGYARYYCAARVRSLSKCESVPAAQLETAVVSGLAYLAPALMSDTAPSVRLKAQIDVVELALAGARAKRSRWVEAIGAAEGPIPVLVQQLEEAEANCVKLKEELAALHKESDTIEDNPEALIAEIARVATSIDSERARAELRENISRVLERAVVRAASGVVGLQLRGSDLIVWRPLHEGAMLPGL